MKLNRNKIYSFALAAVFALTLAGCGGGGGGTAEEPAPPVPTPEEMCTDAGGRYNADGSCTSAADLDQEMIDAAQMAAAMAAAAANTALDEAKAAFNAIAGLESYDELHYGLVSGAVSDAVNAKQAADAANQAAMDADTPEAAREAQKDAEDARDAARDALADANMFAQAVKNAKAAVDQAEADRLAEEERMRMEAQLTEDLAAAVKRAMDANAAAAGVPAAAAAAVATVTAMEGATPAQGAAAQDAANRAATAAATALSSHATAISAQNDRNLTAANAAADAAEQAQMDAEAALGEINAIIAGLQDDIDMAADERQRMMDVAAARTAADMSAMAAEADATKAEAAADRVEEIAPNSAAATSAREAATAARTAATLARAAHAAIMDDMSKNDADEQADEAAKQAMYANGGYMTANTIKDTTETNLGIAQEDNRKRDIANATREANVAAMAARAFATAARTSATNARNAANAANTSYMNAQKYRTDSENAKIKFMEADAAATAAETAATAAEMAADAAEAAHAGIDPNGSGADAQEAQMTAETKQGEASDSADTASTQYMTAMTAMENAAMYASTHVLGLFKSANPEDDPETKDNAATEDVVENNENANRVAAVATALGQAAAAANQTSTAGTEATGISVVWNANVEDDPDTPADEAVTNVREFAITADGSVFAHTDLSADPPTATSKALTPLGALGEFEGVELVREPATGDNVYVHIYTDITQQVPGTPESTVEFDRVVLSGQPVGALSRIELGTDATVTTTAGTSTFTAAYDHDDDGEDAITGATFSCSSGDCSVTFADNEVTQLGSGWTVSGVRAEGTRTIAAVDAVPDADYLTFGVWLSVPDTTGVNNTGVEVGAFSFGSQAHTVNAAITGSATYEGPAVGVRSMGGEVSHVDGTATLTANFGAIDTDAERTTSPPADTTPGSISGTVDIGGMTVHLGEDSDVSDGITGNTRAGDIVHQDAGTATYMYTGVWRGAFYGPADDGATPAQPIAPGSVAGTFGVSGGEDDTAMSLIGAFGAHKQ